MGQERGGRLQGAEGDRGALPRLGWGRGTDLRIEDAPPPVQMRGGGTTGAGRTPVRGQQADGPQRQAGEDVSLQVQLIP